MLQVPNSPHFINSQQKEIQGLCDMGDFDIKDISTILPRSPPSQSIWIYRWQRSHFVIQIPFLCGRVPTRAWLDTYAPVNSWSKLWLMLLLYTILNLTHDRPGISSNPVFMKLTQGWFVDDLRHLQHHHSPTFNDTKHYLQLKRSLYSCKQAAQNWF